MFIQTESTPNPATLMFLPGRLVAGSSPTDFRNVEATERSPLAKMLFGIEGVREVFLGTDFVSITKDERDWSQLKPVVLGALMDHFVAGQPVFAEGSEDAGEDEFFAPEHAGTVDEIKELIETRVRPAVASDGGDIRFRGFKEGTVFLSMKGACSGCPSSTATLKHGIENLLRHFVPGVESVEQI